MAPPPSETSSCSAVVITARTGNIVMNERTDVMRRKDGGAIPLPVTGVFEIVDGKIAKWRDYFDMATVTNAFT